MIEVKPVYPAAVAAAGLGPVAGFGRVPGWNAAGCRPGRNRCAAGRTAGGCSIRRHPDDDAYAIPYSHAHRYAGADRYPHAGANGYAYAHAHPDGYPDSDSDPYSNANANAAAHCYSDPHANPGPDAYAHAYAAADRYPDANAAAYADADLGAAGCPLGRQQLRLSGGIKHLPAGGY